MDTGLDLQLSFKFSAVPLKWEKIIKNNNCHLLFSGEGIIEPDQLKQTQTGYSLISVWDCPYLLTFAFYLVVHFHLVWPKIVAVVHFKLHS